MLLKKKDDTLVTYVQAAKGEASTVKKHLPFVWADVDYMERMLGEEESLVILAKDENAIVWSCGWLA